MKSGKVKLIKKNNTLIGLTITTKTKLKNIFRSKIIYVANETSGKYGTGILLPIIT